MTSDAHLLSFYIYCTCIVLCILFYHVKWIYLHIYHTLSVFTSTVHTHILSLHLKYIYFHISTSTVHLSPYLHVYSTSVSISLSTATYMCTNIVLHQIDRQSYEVTDLHISLWSWTLLCCETSRHICSETEGKPPVTQHLIRGHWYKILCSHEHLVTVTS